MNVIDFKPKGVLRFHLHTEETFQEFLSDHEITEIIEERFLYSTKCLREACVMARRLQCTVWYEDIFVTYVLRFGGGFNIYINPNDEYDDVLDYYYECFYDDINKYIRGETLKKIGLEPNHATNQP